MMDFLPKDVVDFFGALTILVCAFVLFQNASFSGPKVFDFFLNLQIRATSSFMAAGGILLYMQWITEAPVQGTSDHVIKPGYIGCSEAADAMCTKYSNSSLPKAWFEDTTRVFYTDHSRCLVYYICILMFAYCDVFATTFLFSMFRRVLMIRGCLTKILRMNVLKTIGLGHFLPLATSAMLPDDNEEERRFAVVDHMLTKLRYVRVHIVYFVMLEVYYLSVAVFGLLVNPVGVILADHLPISLNGSGWNMVCGREITSQDVYAMVKCRSVSNGDKIDSYCIVPNNSSLFHLETTTWVFLLFLAISCAVSLLMKFYGIWKYGVRRYTDINLIRFLKRNVKNRKNRATVELFGKKLEERTTQLLEEESGKGSKEPLTKDVGLGAEVCDEIGKMEEKEAILPTAEDLEKGFENKNKVFLFVLPDDKISNPD